MRVLSIVFTALVALFLIVVPATFGLLIAYGGPAQPPPLPSVRDPYQKVDFSDIPQLSSLQTRDGSWITYHGYRPSNQAPKALIVLLHGHASRSDSMHALARALGEAGFLVYVPDVRGHGPTTTKGDIDYIGQLEDDIEDLLKIVEPVRPRFLMGFSGGGGLALRFAADPRQKLFDRYMLLSPFVHQSAPNYRAGVGGLVNTGLARYIAILILDRMQIKTYNHLPVQIYAMGEVERSVITGSISYSLAENFRPKDDWKGQIQAARQPMEIVAGQSDEIFISDKIPATFAAAGKQVPVTLVPGVTHVGLITSPQGIEAVVATVRRAVSR